MRAPQQTLYISDRAMAEIVTETVEHLHTETGGVLLGLKTSEAWYVVESLDPGPGAVLEHSFFEYNHEYLTHLANKVARRYHNKLRLLGLWHRHPGSFDSFSNTDDTTNLRYAEMLDGEAISGLINLDPDFRMTFYHVEAQPLSYTRLSVRTGDENFPPDLLTTWDARSRLRAARLEMARPRLTSSMPATPPAEVEYFTEESYPATRTERLMDERSNSRGCLGLLLGGRRQPALRHRPRRQALSPPAYTTSPAQRSADDMPEREKKIFAMLDAELDFLEGQTLYDYALSRSKDGLLLVLTRTGQDNGRDRISFLLTLDRGEPAVELEGEIVPYEPGFVKGHLQLLAQNRSESLSTEEVP
ncbi:MAG: hypothetical protein QOF89_1670 [Acidobacteriota bacterium]|jgi:integrative and conjugative element protein (TIGR02256 family)|nr:hypothetical protein [Acidobacteriota bacterium]